MASGSCDSRFRLHANRGHFIIVVSVVTAPSPPPLRDLDLRPGPEARSSASQVTLRGRSSKLLGRVTGASISFPGLDFRDSSDVPRDLVPSARTPGKFQSRFQ